MKLYRRIVSLKGGPPENALSNNTCINLRNEFALIQITTVGDLISKKWDYGIVHS